MAQIKKRENKAGEITYLVRIRLKGYPETSKTFQRLTDAKEWAAQTETDIRRGLYFRNVEAEKHTLKELVDRYLFEELDHLKSKDDKQKRTMQLEWWVSHLGAYRLCDITASLLRGCLKSFSSG